LVRIFLRQLALNTCSISDLTQSPFVHYLGKTEKNDILLFPNGVLLLNLNTAQKHNLLTYLTLWLTFHLIVLFFNCLQQNWLKCGCIVRTQAWRCFPHLLTAVSIMFCFRPIQTSPVTSWIHKHSWTSSGGHTTLWQSNLVID